MTANVTTRISIAASASEVFEYLTNLKYYLLWNPQITNLSGHGKLKLNSTYSTTSNVLGVTIKSKNVITKFRADKLIQIENKTGLVHYIARFTLKPDRKKTLVICATTVSSESSAFAFAVPVLKLLARRELQTDLQALKLACEHQLLQ